MNFTCWHTGFPSCGALSHWSLQGEKQGKADAVCEDVQSVEFGSAMDSAMDCACGCGLHGQGVCQKLVLQWIADAGAGRCNCVVVAVTKLIMGKAESGVFH